MKITVAQLIKELELFNPEDEVCFGSDDFSFYRTKDRGGEVQIEFNEAQGRDYILLPPHQKYEGKYGDNFVVYDNSGCVWGCGDNTQEVLEDAEENYTDQGYDFNLDFKRGQLKLHKATPRLVVHAELKGGSGIRVGINEDGYADLVDTLDGNDNSQH